jgi:hypothetical protein
MFGRSWAAHFDFREVSLLSTAASSVQLDLEHQDHLRRQCQPPVTRIENGADAKQSTIDRLQRALEAAGIEFIQENGGGPGVRLRKRPQKKS